MRHDPHDLEDAWGLLLPNHETYPEPTSANDNSNRLWVGLLSKVPYSEVTTEGYQRLPVEPSEGTIDVTFFFSKKTVVRGVALWMDSTGGNPIYWRPVEPHKVDPSVTFDLTMTLCNTEGEPYRPSGLLRALGVA